MTNPNYVFTPPATPSLTVSGNSARFAVNRIFCVGRNYVEHIREIRDIRATGFRQQAGKDAAKVRGLVYEILAKRGK